MSKTTLKVMALRTCNGLFLKEKITKLLLLPNILLNVFLLMKMDILIVGKIALSELG